MCLLAVLLCGCESDDRVRLHMPSDPMVFTESSHETYNVMKLEYEGKNYIPYCSAAYMTMQCDEVIGYYIASNDSTIYVLSYKGLSSDEWIIECSGEEGDAVSSHDIDFLLRRESVTEIPEELQGLAEEEYEWNKGLNE